MKKTKRNHEIKHDPYEGMVRLENLDAYEALIKFNRVDKKNN